MIRETLAQMNPEVSAIVYGALGFLVKAVIEWAINVFKSTISTPVRVKKLEEDFKREFDEMKLRDGARDKNIETNWTKYHELEKRIDRLEREE